MKDHAAASSEDGISTPAELILELEAAFADADLERLQRAVQAAPPLLPQASGVQLRDLNLLYARAAVCIAADLEGRRVAIVETDAVLATLRRIRDLSPEQRVRAFEERDV